jgi:hypothetical protein
MPGLRCGAQFVESMGKTAERRECLPRWAGYAKGTSYIVKVFRGEFFTVLRHPRDIRDRM